METTKYEKEELPDNPYERMCRALYAYRFGNIGFLELLDKFEEILGIESSYGMTGLDGKETFM